ncbi:hypothetical protein EDD16DRAFT_1526142 [Pisolithus croceorrhizus]|nr:hypothetical protein EDD16DRAFT_1526142 [Pisolithus croceorrhizus]KAI6130577.1 hypothetical protein EV401DRAFT_2125646 [Pisolithus croceorrhizus]KAI6161817.1 hypothetical protein EDD17DRAFT_1508686 [Pisolithus thermaeus]
MSGFRVVISTVGRHTKRIPYSFANAVAACMTVEGATRQSYSLPYLRSAAREKPESPGSSSIPRADATYEGIVGGGTVYAGWTPPVPRRYLESGAPKQSLLRKWIAGRSATILYPQELVNTRGILVQSWIHAFALEPLSDGEKKQVGVWLLRVGF